MANPVRGEVGFEADGTPYTLMFSTNALCALEDALGMSVTDIGAQMSGSVRLKTLRSLFWAGLQDHHAGVSEAEAGRIIDQVGAAEAGELIGRAFAAAFPQAEEAKAGSRPRTPAAGTGLAS